ncbi:MAG: transcription termination/antitermination protein NusA [Candidatus Omnitrophica bacterium]|nr:transcription termination/antitermination protein NusA [Candidatus Omnitrophota bacterium]
MNGELLSILSAIERDKGIDREILIQAIEAAVTTAAKKSEGASEETEATATLDRHTGRMVVLVGGRPVDSAHLTRIAAQTAKQVIIQKIREAERDVVFAEFQGRIGDIIAGAVHRFERGDIIVELGRAEAVLPKSERIPHEEYHQGDMIQGYVLEVRKDGKGPSVVLSRTHEGFIKGLFVLEVPEIAEGIVEIKGIAREPGDRTKIAVASKDERVDCVGACVGMRGTRVKNIVRELHGEKVDIIRWHDDIKAFIAAALSPAKIADIEAHDEAKQAVVIVEDDQLSLAIGKRGQNVRLASKLTGWQLEITSRSQLTVANVSLRNLPGVGPSLEERLKKAHVTTVQQLASMTVEALTAIEGIGEKTAQKLLESANAALTAKVPTTKDTSVPAPTESAPEAPAAESTSETDRSSAEGSDEDTHAEPPPEGRDEEPGQTGEQAGESGG